MVIVSILWHIRAAKEKDFIKAWKEEFYVNDRSKLIGEFLCKPLDDVEDKYKSWAVGDYKKPDEDMIAYVNVALWESFPAFKAEIARYIPEPGEKQPDFAIARYRVVLEPTAWRIGHTRFPRNDSGRTF